MPLVIALFSGGLDSMLAVRLLQRQGFDVEGLYVRTWFRCCRTEAAAAAAELGMRLTVASAGNDYAEVLRRPRFGYGRGANPCVDCRIYMCRLAKRLMEQHDAAAVITGEVVGQRPMSQKRRDLDVIAFHSGLEGRLLRPLSAQCLPPTIPETDGLVDRSRLCDFTGQSRAPLIQLAGKLGITRWPGPSSGCALVHPTFGRRVHELIQLRPQAGRREFEFTRFSHYRWLSNGTKAVLGRNAAENDTLAALAAEIDDEPWVFLEPENFPGPSALIVGPSSEATLREAAEAILQRTRRVPADPQIRVRRDACAEPVILRAPKP
jgi:hypothetical protein